MKQYLRTAKIKIPANGPRYIDWPAYGDNIRIVTCPVPIVVDFHRDDMEPFTMLQGMRKPLAAGTTYNKLTFTRLPANEEGDPFSTQEIEIFLAWGFGELEDNLTASSFSNINVEGINKLVEAVQLPTWTRLLPRVSGGAESPGLGNLHALSNSVAVQVAVRNPAALRRIIRIRRGWVNKEVYNISLNVGSPSALAMLLVSPVAAGTEKWAPASLRDVVIDGGDPIWLTAWADFGEQGPWEGIRIEEVYRAKVPLA